jgi:hypothetical protein
LNIGFDRTNRIYQIKQPWFRLYIVFYISYHFKSIGKKNLCVSQYSPFFIFCLQLLNARFFILPESFGVLPPVLCLPVSIAP